MKKLRVISSTELAIGQLLYPERVERPQTRADCIDGPRPCPYVGCRYNLYLEVDQRGGLHLPQHEPWAMERSCALDVADEGEQQLLEVARLLDVSHTRILQIQAAAHAKIAARMGEDAR